LAHLWIAEATQTNRLGSFLGDFVKGKDLDAIPPEIRIGIKLHRLVDGYTDRHPILQDLRPLFPSHLQRYRGICLDLFWDYCLSQQWNALHSQPKALWIRKNYTTLQTEMGRFETSTPALPGMAQAKFVLRRLIEYDWLSSYHGIDNIRIALERIGQRLKKSVPLEDSVDVLTTHEDHLQACFAELFNDTLTFSKQSVADLTDHP